MHNTTPCLKVAQNADTVGATSRALGPRTLLQQHDLTRLTSDVREALVNDFDALARELSPGQIRASSDEPWSMKLFFDTALEGCGAARVRQPVEDNADSVLSDIRWTGRINAP
ncbi:hypothetical protein [Gimesia chilikensis]|uniref:hypothetical protein n=1 Tax=Gimesia chilikensis TaxID=2605989 RepID=UPI003A905434